MGGLKHVVEISDVSKATNGEELLQNLLEASPSQDLYPLQIRTGIFFFNKNGEISCDRKLFKAVLNGFCVETGQPTK